MNIAIIGKTTNIPEPKYQIEATANDCIILDGECSGHWDEGWVYPFFKDWAQNHNVPYKIIYYFTHKYDSKETWYKEIVDMSDKIIIYCDDKKDSLTTLELFIISYAKNVNKEVQIFRLEPMYHFHFLIRESDDKDFTKAFTIRKTEKILYEKAKAQAIIEAEIQYLFYVHQWDNYPSALYFTLYIEEERDYRLFWKEIYTHGLESWYNDELKRYYS